MKNFLEINGSLLLFGAIATFLFAFVAGGFGGGIIFAMVSIPCFILFFIAELCTQRFRQTIHSISIVVRAKRFFVSPLSLIIIFYIFLAVVIFDTVYKDLIYAYQSGYILSLIRESLTGVLFFHLVFFTPLLIYRKFIFKPLYLKKSQYEQVPQTASVETRVEMSTFGKINNVLTLVKYTLIGIIAIPVVLFVIYRTIILVVTSF